MKRNLKTHLRDVVIYLTSGSILLASCEAPYVESFTKENFAKDEDSGRELIPLDIYLNKEELSLVQFIKIFANDVLTKPEISVEFKKDPKSVLSRYNLEDVNIDSNSPEIQIILTLGDKEIQDALLKGDFTTYIKLLKEKNLLQSDKIRALDQILQSNGDITIQNDEKTLFIICFVLAVIYVAVATVAVGEVVAYLHFGVAGPSVQAKSNQTTNFFFNQFLNDNALKLWINKQTKSNTYNISEPSINQIIESINKASEALSLEKESVEKLVQIAVGTIEKIEE